MIDLLIEKYIGRASSGMGSKSKGDEIFEDPSNSELNDAGGSKKKIRFIADSKTKKLLVWNYKGGYHNDVWEEYVSKTIDADISLTNFDCLWGIAKREKGKWIFYRSDAQGFEHDDRDLSNHIKKYKWLRSNFDVTKWLTDSKFREDMRKGGWE